MKTPTQLPPILATKLADFRRRVWLVKLTEGLLAALFGIVLSYVLVFVLDRFFETPRALRFFLLLTGAATLGLGLPLKWHRWVWRQRRLEDAARLLRRTFPRLGDQLLGIVELARLDHSPAGQSERLVQAAMAQAAEAIKDRDFSQAVPEARHRQWAWAAAGIAALALLAFAGVNAAARNAFSRWLTPWREIERFTFAKIDPLPARLVIPYAESFTLPVRLSAHTEWSPSMAAGKIAAQNPVRQALTAGEYPLAFPPQKEDATLAVSLGDVRKTILLEPRPRPELTDLTLHLRLPNYLQYQTEPAMVVRGGSINVLRGAQAAWLATASRPLAHAELDGQVQTVQQEKIVTGFAPVDSDADHQLNWRDLDGLTPREPLAVKVHAVADEPPRIVARRGTLEQVVLDSEVVDFTLQASDDFGVKRVGLDWTGLQPLKEGAKPVHGEKIASSGAPEKKELEAPATFCATREGVAPQVLEVRAWAEDFLPGREHVRSAAFTLVVLNKTDHALWLTEQFGKWLEVAKESYEREQQLHETNKELRALSPADLDRPENHRRVAQQASAENANAARVESLTQSGRHLVEQATKNDEFDAQRLESWATMLRALKDIAAQRMPSVADLLKQAANSAAGKFAQNAPGNSPSPTNPSAPKTPGAPALANQQKTAPGIAQGPSLPPNANPAPPASDAPPKPAAPSIADREGGFMKPGETQPPNPNAAPKPPGGGKLRLPGTTLAAAPEKKTEPPPPESPAQQKIESAVTEQRDLLAEFAKVSDQLGQILASLEASTFVKRFKAAAHQQMALASKINQQTLDAFGIEKASVAAALPLANTAQEQSEIVRVIQADLEGYFQRKPENHFKTVLEEMKKTEIVQELSHDGSRVTENLTGQSMIGSEFWSDALDRWAEDLVGASKCKSCSSCSGDSLPPEIVLKVMKALRDEMKLRDETRELENSKPALEAEQYPAEAQGLATSQTQIQTHTQNALDDVLALPEGSAKFSKEVRLLTQVVSVMDEAHGILQSPETGATAVAAETEAIELLLQAKRANPKGGGGGGSTPGRGNGPASASEAALADLGPGADATGVAVVRPVGQATGHAGKEFPEEFKSGLDAYFNLLENVSARP